MAWGGGKGSPIFFARVDFSSCPPMRILVPGYLCLENDYEKYSTLLANINTRLYTAHPLAVQRFNSFFNTLKLTLNRICPIVVND